MKTDARIDAYIAKAQLFARPILEHVRERVRAVVPDVEETLKWGAPAFVLDGKILLMMAAFKAHAALNFWRGQELRGEEANADAMGQFGKLTAIEDLPPDDELDALIRQAAELTRSVPAPRKAELADIRHPTSGARRLPAFGPARLSRMDHRRQAGRHPPETHRYGHRMAQRRQAPHVEI